MASWWEDYKKRKGLSSGGSESKAGRTYSERITTDEHRQAAKSSTWWEDYKKKNDLERKAAADRQRAAQSASRLKYRSERSQRIESANRQLEQNRNRDAAEDEIRELFRNPFSSDAEWQAGVLQRNAERYKRDLPLYQQAMQNSSTWGEYFSAHRQAGESQSAVKHQFERYQQATQKAEQDRNENNLVNRPALYASEHMTPEQISAELDRLRSGAATPTVTDKDRNDPVYAFMYPEAALQKVPHGARFDERLLEGAGQDAIDALNRPILTEQEKAAVEEADRKIIEDKANRNYERVQILKAAQSMQTERTSRETGSQLMEEIATGGAAAKQVEAGRDAFEAKQHQIASETSFEIGDDLDSNRGAYNKMQKERRERGYILGYDWDNVPEARKQAVYALYAQDPEKAMELAKYYIADARQAEDEERQAWYAQSGWTAALGLISSAAAHLGAAVDPFGDVGQELTRRGDNALAGGSQWADAATGYQKIPEWVPIVGGKGAGDFYQIVGSAVQSTAVVAPAILAGRYDKAAAEVLSNLGLFLMGSSAAASDYRESVAAGMDEDRAKLHALAAGVEEALFEKVSLDKLIKMDTRGGLKSALKNWLVQSGIEGSEELATSIANRFTDELISGAGQSKVERRASELIANGMNSTEAHTQAESEWMTDTLYEGFSGFLSGGMMTGGNYALQGLANLKERAVNAAETRKAQKQAGAAVSRSEGSVEALQAYAKDKGIEIKAVETAEQNAGESAEQGEQGSAQNSYSSRDYRSISDTNSKVVQSIRSDLRGKTVQEQQAVRDSLVEKYGEGIAPVVNNAISIEIASRVRQEYGDVDSIQTARNRAIKEIKDESLRRAVSDGYDSAAYSLAASQGGEGGMNTMSRYIQQRNNTGTGEMSMNATVTAQDGSTKTIAITGMSEDGKRVSLADGSEVAVKDLQADADTTSAIQQLADLDLGADATKVLQAYQQSGVTGTEGYRWLMDYATAYNQGRTRQISLEQAAQRSSLDERTVMDAYTLGQQAANRETQAGLEKLKNLPKRKGASGRSANIDTTEIKGKTMSKSELEQFELANQYAQALGVDMKWFSSKEKDGKFVGKNGAYENGKIYMDIHAGRNFAADLTSGILATMGHELSHFEQQYAPEEYQAIKEFLFEQIVKSSPNGEARLERLIWEKQKRSGNTLSRKAAEDEVVADACQKMLRDSKAVHDFASQQPQAANGVVRWLDKWFKRVRSIFGRGGNYSEEAQLMDSLEQDVKAAFGELWDKALKQAVQVHDEVGNIEKTTTEGESNEESEVQNSDRDIEYLELAKDPEKNAAKLQEMVDEAAESAGFEIEAHHITDADFTVFDLSKAGKNTDAWAGNFGFAATAHLGFWFTDNPDSVKAGTKASTKDIKSRLKIERPYEVSLDQLADEIIDRYCYLNDYESYDDAVEAAESEGKSTAELAQEAAEYFRNYLMYQLHRDGIIVDDQEFGGTSYVVFESSRAKSADPVTYDDQGNLIPLSERFNPDNPDIRYSERDYSTPSDEELLDTVQSTELNDTEQKRLLTEYQTLRRQIKSMEKRLGTLEDNRAKLNKKIQGGKEYSEKYVSIKDKEIENLRREIETSREYLQEKMLTPKLADLLKAQRRNAAEKAKQQKEAQFARYKEGKAATDLRGRISSLKKDLQKSLLHPTDTNYVPAGLAKSIVDALDALDTSPKEGTQSAAKYAAISDKLRAVAVAYNDMHTSEEVGYEYTVEYDQELAKMISDLAKTMEGRNARDLSADELKTVYDYLRSIRDTMVEARKLLSNLRYESVREAIASGLEQQSKITPIDDVSKMERKKRLSVMDKRSPMRAVEFMSNMDRSAALYDAFQQVEAGDEQRLAWSLAYQNDFRELKSGKNEKTYWQSLTKQSDYGATDKKTGKPVTMTKMQAIQLFMTAQREAANKDLEHFFKGGATIRNANDIMEGKENIRSNEVFVTPELLKNIENSFTEWDRQYMARMRDYLKREGKAVNNVFYKLKHRVLALEENYVPTIVDQKYLDAKLETTDFSGLFVKSPRSTQAITKGAPQPLIIDGMETMMNKHVQEQAQYIGMATAIRDFAKIFNGKVSTSENGVGYTSLKAEIERNFGKKGVHLITQALIDIQGGSTQSGWRSGLEKVIKKLQTSFVRHALLFNLSVTIKQAASYVAAGSIISREALLKGNRSILNKNEASHSASLITQIFLNPNGKTAQEIFARADKYTALHADRRNGMNFAEVELGQKNYGKLRQKAAEIGANLEQKKGGHKVREIVAALNPASWIQRMDVATTAALLVACEYQARMDGLEGEAYHAKVKELYERVLRETQPMYDSLHRTAQQKSGGSLAQYLFPFRTVPIQNHGQMASAYDRLLAAKTKSDTEKAAAAKFFRKTLLAQIESAVVFSAMTFAAALTKRKTKKYRDEDGELTLESVARGFGLDVASTLVSVASPMWGSELWSLSDRFINKLTGKGGYTYDSFSVGALDMINDTAAAIDKIAADVGKAMRREDVSMKEFGTHMFSLLTKVGNLSGIPADTIKTYTEGFIGNIQDAIDGRIPALNDESWERDAATNARRYLKAYLNNDTQKASAVLAELRSNLSKSGKDEGKINEAIRKYVSAQAVEKVADGTWTEEEAEAYLLSTGAYDDRENPQKDAWNAIRKGVAKSASTDEEYSWKQYDELADAVANGEDVTDILTEYRNHGYSDDQINAAIRNGIQEAMASGDLDGNEAADALIRYGVTYSKDGKDVAYDEQTAWKKVQEWADKAEHTDEDGELEDGYKYSAYADLFDAVDANQNADGIIQAMVQNGGYDTDGLRSQIKDHLIERFISGQITETALKNQLSRYCKITKTEDANEIVKNAKCKRDFGVSPDGLKGAFKDGDLSQNQAEKALQQYKGLSKTDAQNRVQYWGYDGDLSENAWLKWNKDLKGSGLSVENWEKVSKVKNNAKGTDANGDGRADSGTVKAEVVAYIDSMNIPKSQKKAIYLAFGWAASTMPNWR